jgi:hypothetical protein
MPKLALKLLLTASALHRRHRQTDWCRTIAIFSTLATIGLIALYVTQRGMVG